MMSLKVCEIIRAHQVIRAGDGAGPLSNRAVQTVQILNPICGVKSEWFSMIFAALPSPESALQSSSSKVLRSRAFSRRSRVVTD